MMPEKSTWGDGPWQSEPDHHEWRFRGMPCIIERNQLGAWCGYVAVPPGHPWHGVDYDNVGAQVHGGLTYAEPCQGSVCHVPLPGEADGVWWLGFDCSHWDDLQPAMRAHRDTIAKFGLPPLSMGERGTYRDQAWVMRETESLAEQALRVTP